jgi:ubiquinone/menaquinone biosynthesis C-methylase UbiE
VVDLSVRSNETELMDDLSRPDFEFVEAYNDLTAINKHLGGIRAVERFLPEDAKSVLDVASGACDVGEALVSRRKCRVVSLDMNPRGLKFAVQTAPVAGDALRLPFADNTFDAVICSLFFHHLTNSESISVLREMWRVARRTVIVNDLHRNRVAHASIRILSALFSRSTMFRNDSAVSVRRAFRPGELADVALSAGVPAQVYRSFPYRLVLVAKK